MVAFECWLAYQRSSSLSRSLPRKRASVRSTTAMSSLMSVPVYMALTPCPALKFLSGQQREIGRIPLFFETLPRHAFPGACRAFNHNLPQRKKRSRRGPRQVLRSETFKPRGPEAPLVVTARFGAAKATPCYNLSAARSFALRDRGLRSISSSLAVTGFFVNRR